METKHGFTKMTITEFETWIANLRVGRTILKIQQHHTYIPAYIHFNGSNHFERQLAMKNHHVNHNGWQDIGQHFTIFPDGSILTGRSLEKSPACITNQNANSICIENFGDFDLGKDVMLQTQKDAIIAVTAALCKRFNLPVNTMSIVYHHWFRLDNGQRTNDNVAKKSCPGTNFFGGNKEQDCITNFLPLVEAKLTGNTIKTDDSAIQKYVVVTANHLNIRTQPKASAPKAADRNPAILGAILRVYGEQNNWYKISNSQSHWVSARYTDEVKRATVKATSLNVRSGGGTNFQIVGSVIKDEEVFIIKVVNNWCQISMEDRWVSKEYLDF
jgi:SH3-like domain-containing protein